MGEAVIPDRLRDALATSIACVVLAAGAPAAASELDVEGFVVLRGTGVRSQPSWREGAFGRVTLGAESSEDEDAYATAKLHLALDWQPSPFFGAFIHLAGRAEPGEIDGREIGIVEAVLHAAAPLGRSGALNFQLGHFFLPTSRENVEVAWSSPYTLTLSALNTWIGEEMRLTGLAAEYQLDAGQNQWRLGAAAFGGNDSNGALLAWRGWALGDRLSVFGEVVPLPPLSSLADDGVFYRQRDDGTKPFGDDLDDRAGWAGYLRWHRRDRALIQVTRYDNRGDRRLYRGEYAWRTEVDLIGVELRPHHSLTFAGEALSGSTGMGFVPPRKVQADFETAYLLASWQRHAFRATLRYDLFEVFDVDGAAADDGAGADDNDEDGDAWTFAVFYEPRQDLRLGLELSHAAADRPAAAAHGFDPDTGADSVKLELRWYFGS